MADAELTLTVRTYTFPRLGRAVGVIEGPRHGDPEVVEVTPDDG